MMFIKKTITLLSAAVLLAVGAKAQKHADSVVIDGKVYQFVEQMPEFPGGNSAIGSWLSENIHYPDSARKANIQGKVIIRFVVDTDGTISDATVLGSVDKDIDKEALRVIRTMPKWKPGIQNGKLVKVYYTIPIMFRLEDPEPEKKN